MRGGNTAGDYDPRSNDYSLYCLDTPSRRDHIVMKNAGLQWSWTYNGQILCSLVKSENQGNLVERTGRPSVYAVNARGGKPTKLFDGGYYAQESPDGRWIAFCDWPGELFDAPHPSEAVKNNRHKGLFLFDRATKQRVFVGGLNSSLNGWPVDGPLLQWSPKGETLYVLDSTHGEDAIVYKVDIRKRQLEKLSQLTFNPGTNNCFFRGRGISPDGKTLYYEAREGIASPPRILVQKFTLHAVDTRTGHETPLASLMNVQNENPDWDFHDDTGINPALAAAEKIERGENRVIKRSKKH